MEIIAVINFISDTNSDQSVPLPPDYISPTGITPPLSPLSHFFPPNFNQHHQVRVNLLNDSLI